MEYYGSKTIVFELPRENVDAFIERIAEEYSMQQKIAIVKNPNLHTLSKLADAGNLFRVLESFDEDTIRSAVSLADQQYDRMIEESQNHVEAEEGQDEKKNLSTKKRITTLNKQVESLHQALVAVHQANSVGEVESLLFHALKDSLDLEWCRILFRHNEHVETQLSRLGNVSLFKVTLTIGDSILGSIIFGRSDEKPFGRFEDDLLRQVAEGVAMAIDRLTKLEQAESLKQQWESTFDAIAEPLCLTDESFNIIRTNSAFSDITGLKYKDLIGANCFAAFCGNEPDLARVSAATFKLQRPAKKNQTPRTYEVSTQKIQIKESASPIFMIFFRDITEQQKIQKQIFESAKMAELGTIGSSIAHELNNPLGGMISFLQLIRMDMKKTDAIYEDVIEMEAAGQRCKEIVENLLGFTRQHDASEAVEVDLREILRQALKITELQARSLGVTVEMKWPQVPVKILGNFNLLAQAISHLLQNSFEAVSDNLAKNPRSKGHITITLKQTGKQISLDIEDNGIGINPENQNKIFNPLFSTKTSTHNPGLGLTLAYKIVDDHSGQLEIYSQPKMGTRVKIALTSV